MKIDKAQNVFLVGYHPSSTSFPLVNKTSAYNSSTGRGIIIKFNSSLATDWVTNFGASNTDGNDIVTINFDPSDNAIMSGRASYAGLQSPVTLSGAYNHANNGGGDIFLAMFDHSSNNMTWLTYLGGSGYEEPLNSCQTPDLGSGNKTEQTNTFANMYLIVQNGSTNFPKVRSGIQFYDSLSIGSFKSQIVKIDLNTKAITWSTGFRFSNLASCVVDNRQNLTVLANYADTNYILKHNTSSGYYYKGSIDYVGTSQTDCGISIFSAADTLIHSSYIGGDNSDGLGAISSWGDYFIYRWGIHLQVRIMPRNGP